MKQGACNQQSLLHAVGILLNVVIGAIEQPDLVQRLVYSVCIGTVKAGSKGEVLSGGHTFVEILMLGDDTDERFEAALFCDHVTTGDSRVS